MKKKRTMLMLLCLFVTSASTALANDGFEAETHMPHRMMMLVIQLGTIIFAARVGHMLLERLKMPGVLGEIIAGVIIGPYLLGAVSLPGFSQGLFPLASEFPVTPELYGICSIAAVILLFVVGLETDIKLFMRYSLAGSLVGIGGVSVSFVCGDLMAVMFSRVLFGEPLGFLSPPCLFLGIISTATSVGISARILSEKRKMDSPEGVTILAGAVIDDVLGMILLAIGLGLISASGEEGQFDWANIGIIAAKAVSIWLAATAIGLLASRKIGVLLKLFRDRSSIAMMALALALTLAGLFEKAGLAMIVGAYVMGMSLAMTDVNRVIREKLNPIHAFLVPVFFAVMGMLVDIRLLLSTNVLLVGAVYTAVVNLAKIVGCGLPALFCNFNLRGAARIGFGMLPRGEVTLIIAGVGLTAGVLTPEAFGIVIMMILVTAVIAPPALVYLFRNDDSGLRKTNAKEDKQHLTFTFPSTEIAALLVSKLLSAFESEGFFVHSLSRREKTYQLLKEDRALGFRHDEADIVFKCNAADVPLVDTAMLEVVAELERAVEELRRPVDRTTIGRKLLDAGNGASDRRPMASHISPATLSTDLKAKDKPGVIDELLGIMQHAGLLQDVVAARESVWLREKSMSTGMQYGVALPHAKTNAVEHTTCAVGLKPEGIDFQSIDGELATIFVLVLTPLDSPAPHMEFLSAMSQVLDGEGRETLLACRTAQEMYSVLTRKDGNDGVSFLGHRRK